MMAALFGESIMTNPEMCMVAMLAREHKRHNRFFDGEFKHEEDLLGSLPKKSKERRVLFDVIDKRENDEMAVQNACRLLASFYIPLCEEGWAFQWDSADFYEDKGACQEPESVDFRALERLRAMLFGRPTPRRRLAARARHPVTPGTKESNRHGALATPVAFSSVY